MQAKARTHPLGIVKTESLVMIGCRDLEGE